MRKYNLILAALLIFTSCKKEKEVQPSTETMVPGGIGGKYNIAIFPLKGSIGITGKCFIKYACKEIPNNPIFDDSVATMIEPGFGQHSHFFNLKSGYYYIKAIGKYQGNQLIGDTLLEIHDNQNLSVDYNLQLK
jgi:hypothetical protein